MANNLLTERASLPATATRGQLRERAFEVGTRDGRGAPEVTKTDWDQAKQELIGAQPCGRDVE